MWHIVNECNQEQSEDKINDVHEPSFSKNAPVYPIDSSISKRKLLEPMTAIAKVASLVAADYNDFDDENSQPTPPGSKECNNTKLTNTVTMSSTDTKHETEICTELELLAESENIVIFDHVLDDNITSEVLEECVITSADIAMVEDKEKFDQVVEEDEQHVVMMIEENTLTTSFSVEQMDKATRETIIEQSNTKSPENLPPSPVIIKAAGLSRSEGRKTLVCASESVTDITNAARSCSDTENEDITSPTITYPIANVKFNTVDVITADSQIISPNIDGYQKHVKKLAEAESVETLNEKRLEVGLSGNGMINEVKAVMLTASDTNVPERRPSEFDSENTLVDGDDVKPIKDSNSIVGFDSSTPGTSNVMVEESPQTLKEIDGIASKNNPTALTMSGLHSFPLPCTGVEIMPPSAIVNKTITGIINMLPVVDSPESPDQLEMNVDPSPEPFLDDFEQTSSKAGQESQDLTFKVTDTIQNEIPMSKFQETSNLLNNVFEDTSFQTHSKESLSICTPWSSVFQEGNFTSKIQLPKSTESEPFKIFSGRPSSNLEELPPSSIHQSNIGEPCLLKRPVVTYPTISKVTSTVDAVLTKPTRTEQPIISREAVSISLVDKPVFKASLSSKSDNTSLTYDQEMVRSTSNQNNDTLNQAILKHIKSPSLSRSPISGVPIVNTVVSSLWSNDNPIPLIKQELTSLVADSMNLAQLPYPKDSSHSGSPSSTVTVSVINSGSRVSPAAAVTVSPVDGTSKPFTLSSILAAAHPSNPLKKTTQALNVTMISIPQSSIVPIVASQSLQTPSVGLLPSDTPVSISNGCTLSVINSSKTNSPLTTTIGSGPPTNVLTPTQQVSQLLNLPAISLQTLIENNQLVVKSFSSTSQSQIVSSTQSFSGPILSARQSVGAQLPQVEIKPIHTKINSGEVGDVATLSPQSQNQSMSSEVTFHSHDKSDHTIMQPVLNECKYTTNKNFELTRTLPSTSITSQAQTKDTDLESCLAPESYQQTSAKSGTLVNSSLLQSDVLSAKQMPSTFLSQPSVTLSKSVLVPKDGVKPLMTSNILELSLNQSISISTQLSSSRPISVDNYQQESPPPVISLLTVKKELVDTSSPFLSVKDEKSGYNFMTNLILEQPLKPEGHSQSSCKFNSLNRLEESQNVLLKQLLQNTGCAQTQSTESSTSLESRLAQPVHPTPSNLLSPLLLETAPPATRSEPKLSNTQLETSFEPRPLPVSRTPSRDDVVSPLASPNVEGHQSSNVMLTEHPLKEVQLGSVEIKKEVIEDTEVRVETGYMQDQTPLDIKKMKRRQYQQKRRQSQGKEAVGGTPKKRQKKGTNVEEDWDTFAEHLMQSLQKLPPIHVLEPSLPTNPAIGNIFGAGDLTKTTDISYTHFGDLQGSYGTAIIPQVSDFYDSKPFGDGIPLPPPPPTSTQRGFYDQEFAPLKLDNDLENKKNETMVRDTDSPDSVISCSSPECLFPESPIMFPGLRLMNPDGDKDDDRRSPSLPLVAPIPTRLKTLSKDIEDVDKENIGLCDSLQLKSRPTLGVPLRASGNVAVTLTLSSAAADDIAGVLRDLANFLHIPAPTSYQIVERTSTPPSQKLGLYRTKDKDGKEGAPIDIQSILNGEAKFCRHCDVVILSNLIKKKASDLPFLAKEDALDSEDFLNFCSNSCYMQFALMHRSQSVTKDKAAAIVDHLCQAQLSEKPCIETKIQSDEKSLTNGHYKTSETEIVSPHVSEKRSFVEAPGDDPAISVSAKREKNVCYKIWSAAAPQPNRKVKKYTDREMTEMLFRMGITVMPSRIPEDIRVCIFCHQIGDGVADGPARLLNFDVDRWIHLNCALWSDDVYETVNGALMNLDNALEQSLVTSCVVCHKKGATIRCFKLRCSNVYHLGCAVKDECVFFKNKSMYCMSHVPKNEKDNELTTLAVYRRVYVNRDENRQVASVMHRSDHNHLMRVGSLIFLSVGQLLPHQLQAFHTANCIYPIGYKIIRFYWSMRVSNKRCRYVCSIHDVAGRPEFRVLVQEPAQDDLELRDSSAKAVWARILEPMAAMRKEMGGIQVFPRFVSGDDLFGLTEPAIVRVLESLPGVESMTDYRFKYGRNPLLELPLAVNPTGCARSELKLKSAYPWKRPHTQRTATSSRPIFVPTATIAGEAACPYSKQFVHSKSSQYKKMKQEWRNNVYLARSKIQGLGLYAARDLERHTMVIEYIGEVIRTELSEMREKLYEARNRGIYMFRLDEERVVDATLSGGLARYINHSCNPNCVAEIVEVDRDLRIIIFAKRRITRGEELAYDYKFDIEDDQHKIPCNCGGSSCRKWMN